MGAFNGRNYSGPIGINLSMVEVKKGEETGKMGKNEKLVYRFPVPLPPF